MEKKETITLFAKTNFRNREVPFGIKTDDRRRHMYLIGKTGMGKTTLMENMVIQDIRNGHGVAFLDPHGDSVQRILDCVPSSRVNDVIYFNPADMDYPVAFNILESVDPKYKHLVASGLMGVFTKIWANLWSARMEYILNNTILALLDSPGNTLLGITRMYVDKKYRKKIVDNIKDPMVRAFWTDEFANYNEKYRTEAIAPIQNKVGQFLSSGIIRNIVGQPKSTIDLREIMDERKILIMDLSKGRVGEDNSALLGAMIVTKLQLAALSRADVPENERKDFYLYVDEFQNFATQSFATILSEARKYRLSLIVGHQYMGQLIQERDTTVRDAILGNVGTLVIFRIGAEDAENLIKEFEPIFTEIDLVNLPKYHIILKLMINGVASDPFTAVTLPPPADYLSGNGQKVIKVSRERYSNPVAEVEEKISRWMGAEYHQETALLIGKDAQNQEAQSPVEQNIQTDKQVVINMPVVESQKIEASNVQIEEPIEKIEVTAPITTPEPRKEQQGQQPRRQGSSENPRKDQQRGEGRHQQKQQQHNRPRHEGKKNRDQRQPQRKENPVWNTVADLHQQRQKEQTHNLQSILKGHSSSDQTTGLVSRPEPQPRQERRPERSIDDELEIPIPNQTAKTILKPGESHKLN